MFGVKGVLTDFIRVIRDIYNRATSVVRTVGEDTRAFPGSRWVVSGRAPFSLL